MPYKADPWWKSKRIYAAVVMVIALIASLFGYTIGEDQQGQIVEALTVIAAAVGAVLVVISKLLEKSKDKD